MAESINPSAEARNMKDSMTALKRIQIEELLDKMHGYKSKADQARIDLKFLGFDFPAEPKRITREEWLEEMKGFESSAISQIQSELIDKNNRIVFLQKEIFSLRNKIGKSNKKSTTKKTTKKK